MSEEDLLETPPVGFWAARFWDSLGLQPEGIDASESTQAILSTDIGAGVIDVEVQSSRFEPYHVSVRIEPFTGDEWETLLEAFASQAIYSARLLSGVLPPEIVPVLETRGIYLIPRGLEIDARCDCEDFDSLAEGDSPCSHLMAVYRSLAERLDEEPFILFILRGRSRQQILESLSRERARQGSSGTSEYEVLPLEQSLGDFWKTGPELDELRVRVGPPSVSAALLKRLGLPSFWQPHPEIRGSLERLYTKVTERAMALAYQGKGMDAVAEPDPESSDD